MNVVVAARYDTDAILTLDQRDVRAVRPLSRHDAFRLLPMDGRARRSWATTCLRADHGQTRCS